MTRIALAVMAVALVTAGCDDEGGGEKTDKEAELETISGSFVGTVEGTDAYVAVIVAPDEDAGAYVTDGASSVDFLDGALQADDTARLGNDGGAVLEVTFDDLTASGTFTRPGIEPHNFTAEKEPAPAGLYHDQQFFDDGEYVGGWVVLGDGTQRGAVRRYETPLPPGSVDATTFRPGDKTFTVPGGELKPRRVTPDSDF